MKGYRFPLVVVAALGLFAVGAFLSSAGTFDGPDRRQLQAGSEAVYIGKPLNRLGDSGVFRVPSGAVLRVIKDERGEEASRARLVDVAYLGETLRVTRSDLR